MRNHTFSYSPVTRCPALTRSTDVRVGAAKSTPIALSSRALPTSASESSPAVLALAVRSSPKNVLSTPVLRQLHRYARGPGDERKRGGDLLRLQAADPGTGGGTGDFWSAGASWEDLVLRNHTFSYSPVTRCPALTRSTDVRVGAAKSTPIALSSSPPSAAS